MSGNRSRVIISCVFLSILFSLVSLNHRDNAVTASNEINEVHSRTLVGERTNTTDEGVVINEVMFFPGEGQFEWVELKNIGADSVDVSGWSITDEDDNWYKIPDELPPVPAGAFVVIVFDGGGVSLDDYDFGDNVSILHGQAGLVDIFEDEFDQIALYKTQNSPQPIYIYLPLITLGTNEQVAEISTPFSIFTFWNSEDITSFVAWGADPGEDGSNAIDAGIWFSADFIHYSSVDNDNNAPVFANESIGLYPDFSNTFSQNWTIFIEQSSSKGLENPVPPILSFSPGPGETLVNETFSIDWNFVENAIGYRFQMDDNVDFLSPIYDMELETPAFIAPEPIPEGQYYWRVRVLFPEENKSVWTPGHEVNSLVFSNLTNRSDPVTLGIQWQLQRKDTNMLCLFGDKETGDAAWDSEHPSDGGVKEHAVNYCSRATISMIASFYGAELSQDRIAFEDYKNTSTCKYDTCNQLGHNRTNWTYVQPLFESVGITGISWTFSPPSFNEIVGYIDNLRPIVVRATRYGRELKSGYHFLVIDGYKTEEKDGQILEFVHLLDPWDRDNWVIYDEYKGYITSVGVTPNYTPAYILEDEDDNGNGISDTNEDTDGDGICNFDENHRFATDPNVKDTDADGVLDKLDLREYVFNIYGNWSLRRADWDWDGYEDINLNGNYDLGETSNFVSTDERPYAYDIDKMVYIPAGEFSMGCAPASSSCSTNSPLHTVYLSDYYIDVFEVTNLQYQQCVADGGCSPQEKIYSTKHDWYYGNPEFDNYPVLWISWYGASDYCIWAGKQLPTEAQWEKAARGPSSLSYPWGDSFPSCLLVNYSPSPSTFNYCIGDAYLVGGKPLGASPYGLMDMAGNVAEWVYDWYSSSYYTGSPYLNPTGPLVGTSKVIRGGSWGSNWVGILTYSRWYYSPTATNVSGLGFRCVADAP